MAIGTISTTQNAITPYTTTTFKTQVTQVALSAGVTKNFSTQTTQVVILVCVWTAFLVQVTQVAITPWVMFCNSTSYVAPSATGLIVLVAAGGGSGTFEIDLTWTALPNYTYVVKRSLTSGGAQTTIATGLTVNHYTDTGRAANTTYYYQVVGTNPCGDTTTSNEASAAFVCSAPAAPLSLTATWTGTVVSLSWEPVAASTYTVYRIGPGEQSWTAIASGLTTESYSDPVTAEGVYIYAVASVNACGNMVGEAASVPVPCCTQWDNTSTCDTTYQVASSCDTAYTVGPGCDTSYTASAPCGPTDYTPGTTPTTDWQKEGCS